MSAPILDLWLRTQYVVGGLMVTQNEGTAGGTVQCGDGSTAGTFPTQLGPVNGVGHGIVNSNNLTYLQYLAALANATYTYMALCSCLHNTQPQYLFDARSGGGTGYFYIVVAGDVLTPSSGVVYVDGVPATAMPLGSITCVTVAGIALNAPSKLVLLSQNAFGASQGFGGKVFNQRLFSGTLSPAQIATETSRLKALLNT